MKRHDDFYYGKEFNKQEYRIENNDSILLKVVLKNVNIFTNVILNLKKEYDFKNKDVLANKLEKNIDVLLDGLKDNYFEIYRKNQYELLNKLRKADNDKIINVSLNLLVSNNNNLIKDLKYRIDNIEVLKIID